MHCSGTGRSGRITRLRAAPIAWTSCIAVACAPLPAAAQSHFPSDAIVREMVRSELAPNDSVGIVIGVLEADGTRRVIAVGGTAYDGSTLFEIGSITKTFTGILLAEMAGRGEARLDEPVAKLLADTVKLPVRGERQITLVDLATHSSGLPRMPNNFRTADPANPYADYTVDQLYAFLGSVELARDIGAEFEYSNLGVGLLGHALETRAGASYEALLTERVLRPLGMTSTVITLDEAHRERLAPGHDGGGRRVANWDIATLAGAGGLRSTADDMLSYLAANLDPPASALGAAIRQSHEPRFTIAEDVSAIGLNWIIVTRRSSTLVWHNGGTGGYGAFAGFDPERRIGIVVLTNSRRSMDAIGLHLLDASYPLVSSGVAARFLALVLGVLAALVAAVVVAWRRTGRRAGGPAVLATAAVIAWLAVVAWALLGGGLDLGAWPVRLAVAFIAPLGLAVLLGASRVGARLAAGLPLAALVAAQAFRLPLEIVMHRPFRYGESPPGLSVAGWNLDVVTGASAIVLTLLVATGLAGERAVRIWNWLAIVLLIEVTLVVWLNEWIAQTEFIALPAVLLAFATLGHVTLLLRLRAESPYAAGTRKD